MRKPTDWNQYYQHTNILCYLPRRITAMYLYNLAKKYGMNSGKNLKIAELGGGNSSFYEYFLKNCLIEKYITLDTNEYGNNLLRDRHSLDIECGRLNILNTDITDMSEIKNFDLVDMAFSVGLIEHFEDFEAEKVINNHLKLVKNGIVILSFPIATIPYRFLRWFSEKMGWWIFYDEIPLNVDWVKNVLQRHGATILTEKTNWWIGFTQHIIVARVS